MMSRYIYLSREQKKRREDKESYIINELTLVTYLSNIWILLLTIKKKKEISHLEGSVKINILLGELILINQSVLETSLLRE